MYHGLVKLVLVDPATGKSVFDFLWPHFLRFFKEVITSLKLKLFLF